MPGSALMLAAIWLSDFSTGQK